MSSDKQDRKSSRSGDSVKVKTPPMPPPLPPPPRLHATTERIPPLPSAPSSASTSFINNNSSNAGPTLVDLPPPPRMSGISLTPTIAMPPEILQEPLIRQETPEFKKIDTSFDETEQDYSNTVPEPARMPIAPTQHSLLARRQSHIPVLLIATEAANLMAWKNNLRLVDMLDGLAQDLSSVSMPLPPFRSVHRSMLLHWDTLKVSFVEPSDFSPCEDASFLHEYAKIDDGSDDTLEEQVDAMLVDDSLKSGDSLLMDQQRLRQERLSTVAKNAFELTSPPDMPWLVRYRAALDQSTDYLEHDLLQAPPLCLLVCTTNDFASPIECLRELTSPHFLPLPFHNGMLDRQSIRTEAVVLHDNVDGGDLEDESGLKQSLVQQFGAGAAILKINSVMPETASQLEGDDDLWHGGGTRGKCLSVNDRLVLRRYIASMITTSLLPALERRISDLNFIVTDRKKGVKNVFKSLWRKPKEETLVKPENRPEDLSKSTAKYRHDSIESQVRLLADTLFLMRDWDAALGMYRLIKDDYKSDRALLEYGSVNEMMALATYFLDSFGRSREAFSLMEAALFSYTRAAEDERPAGTPVSRPSQASHATRLASRLCLVLSSAIHMTEDRPLEVADLLASASSHETSLGAAVLLEQSSAHYYRAGMCRKYAFHMLMSGHMFRSAAQEHHAFRCFTSALYIYNDGRWDELHNHLRSALAAQLYSLGRMSVSVTLYAKLVGTRSGGRVSTKSQQKFIQHLVEICQGHTGMAMVGSDRMVTENRTDRLERIEQVLESTPGATRVLELPNMDLPAVDDSSVTVSVETKQVQRDVPCFGTIQEGDKAVWEELMCHADAELKAVDPAALINLGQGSSTLASIEDPLTRKVIAAIDKDKSRMNLLAKAKRSGNHKESPAVRACMEPLSVQFVMNNPLSVPIEVEELQLVARMLEAGSQRICTNEDAIMIRAKSDKSSKTWKFASSSLQYEAPEFCRISPADKIIGSWKSSCEKEPFFVVTKTGTMLEPGSSSDVALGICPLVLGELEVLGVRYKLFDDVWVYHPFHIKGRLLQNSSYNKANRVRAESMLLKSKVEQDMPRLTACLLPTRAIEGEGPVLSGQISSWTLSLSNIGTAPAAQLSLKTNIPWVSIAPSEEVANLSASALEQESQPMPHCVGPSGTLLNLPLDDRNLKTPGVLQPGETVDIPILIRTSGSGNQSFYMLYRYELWDASATWSEPRWLQNMIEVPVNPSLTLTASLMPSFWKQNEHILSVEMTNFRSDRPSELDITLDKLSVLSRHYRMELLDGQLGSVQGEASPFPLGWQERVTLHYLVTPLDASSRGCSICESPFAGGGKVEVNDREASTIATYLCMERAQDEFQDSLVAHQIELARAAAAEEDGGHPRSVAQIRRAKSSMSGVESVGNSDDDVGDLLDDPASIAHPTSIARLCPPASSKAMLNIVCTWSALGGGTRTDIVHGQQNFTRLSVRPKASSRGCPITITCKHPSKLLHDFENGPLNIPFEVTVRNRLVDSNVDFEFSVERPKMFDFIGAECFRWSLQGGEELTIPMQAVVSKGGVYNLQSVRLTVDKSEKKVPYLFPLQWIVRVNE